MDVPRRGLALLAGLALFSSPVVAAPAITLDQLMAALRTVRHVNARYTERRTLSALRTPIETRGMLRFDAPDKLAKIADPPGKGERLVIDGDRLTMDRGDGRPPITLSLSSRPEIGVLVDSIRATLAGDGSALSRNFDMTLAGTIDQWQMVLQPRDPALRQFLDWMRIDGAGPRITSVETQDRGGDRSQMTITGETA